MAVDTRSMRELMDAAPGDRMAMEKRHLHALIDATPGDRIALDKDQIRSILDAVQLGTVADQLTALGHQLRAMAVPA